MRIAQVAPLEEAVPPKLYGGIERMVSYLTEALVEAGHEVVLFASGDSETSATLDSCWPQALRLDPTIHDKNVPQILMLEKILDKAEQFDILHLHIDFSALPILSRQNVPYTFTMHGPLHLPELRPLFSKFKDTGIVSCSDSQREPLPDLNWLSTIHHGLPENQLIPIKDAKQDYVAFLGRISPEKGIECAIRIAEGAGVKLKVAAKVDNFDKVFYENDVKHLFDLAHVEYVGEICEAEKAQFLGHASALLFPINWPEPFGLVMIESMACGTPVIAFNHGSVREVVDDGISGFVVEDELAAIAAIQQLKTLSRVKVRETFERRFTSRTMANKYIQVYEELLRRKRTE